MQTSAVIRRAAIRQQRRPFTLKHLRVQCETQILYPPPQGRQSPPHPGGDGHQVMVAPLGDQWSVLIA